MSNLGKVLTLDITQLATLKTFIGFTILDLEERPERNQDHIKVLNKVLVKIEEGKLIELEEGE